MSDKKPKNYADKHPDAAPVDPKVRQKIMEKVVDGRLPCESAHFMASDLGIPPAGLGVALDLMDIRISKCQLGLFGYLPNKKIVMTAGTYPEAIADAVQAEIQEGRISCVACWGISERLRVSKLDVAGVVEALKIKVAPCQLGAF